MAEQSFSIDLQDRITSLMITLSKQGVLVDFEVHFTHRESGIAFLRALLNDPITGPLIFDDWVNYDQSNKLTFCGVTFRWPPRTSVTSPFPTPPD